MPNIPTGGLKSTWISTLNDYYQRLCFWVIKQIFVNFVSVELEFQSKVQFHRVCKQETPDNKNSVHFFLWTDQGFLLVSKATNLNSTLFQRSGSTEILAYNMFWSLKKHRFGRIHVLGCHFFIGVVHKYFKLII